MKFFCFFLLLFSISSSLCNCSNDDYDDLVRKSTTTARPTTGVKGGLQDILSASSCQHLKENRFFLRFPTLKKLCLRTLVQAKIVKLTTGTSLPPATKEATVNNASTAQSTRTTAAPPPRTEEATANKASTAESTRTTSAPPPLTMVDGEVEAQKDNPTNEQPSQPAENSSKETTTAATHDVTETPKPPKKAPKKKKDKKQYPFINMGIW